MWFVSLYHTLRYQQALHSAVRLACCDATGGPKAPLAFGHLVISVFEQTRQMRFDPFDRSHLGTIAGVGLFYWRFHQATNLIHLPNKRVSY